MASAATSDDANSTYASPVDLPARTKQRSVPAPGQPPFVSPCCEAMLPGLTIFPTDVDQLCLEALEKGGDVRFSAVVGQAPELGEGAAGSHGHPTTQPSVPNPTTARSPPCVTSHHLSMGPGSHAKGLLDGATVPAGGLTEAGRQRAPNLALRP